VILQKAVLALGKVVQSIANEIPVQQVAGIHMRQILAALVLVLVGFFAGLSRGKSLPEVPWHVEVVVVFKEVFR
jgi:cbb3-type cytochrome oxidase subunit 1